VLNCNVCPRPPPAELPFRASPRLALEGCCHGAFARSGNEHQVKKSHSSSVKISGSRPCQGDALLNQRRAIDPDQQLRSQGALRFRRAAKLGYALAVPATVNAWRQSANGLDAVGACSFRMELATSSKPTADASIAS
jgi:hypothetical protein